MNILAHSTYPSGLLTAAVIILIMTLAEGRHAEIHHPKYLRLPLATMPKDVAGWQLVAEQPLENRTLFRLAPTDYISRTYQKSSKELGLFIAYYAEQRAGEALHSPKYCLTGGGWEIWKRDSVAIRFQGRETMINQYSVQQASERAAVLYWYQARRRILINEYMVKLMLVRDAILHGDTSAAIVRVVVDDEPEARQSGTLFAGQVMKELQRRFED